MAAICCLQDGQDQVRHRTEYCSRAFFWFPLWLIICGDKILLRTFDLVWTLLLFVRGLYTGELLAMPPPRLVAAARPNVRVSKLQLCRWISSCFFFFRPKDKEQRCIPSERKSCNHSLGPSDLIGKMCGGICYLYREPPNMFKCEVRSPSFLLSKGFLDTICRAQPCADCKC